MLAERRFPRPFAIFGQRRARPGAIRGKYPRVAEADARGHAAHHERLGHDR